MNKITVEELHQKAQKHQQRMEILISACVLCLLFGLVIFNYVQFHL